MKVRRGARIGFAVAAVICGPAVQTSAPPQVEPLRNVLVIHAGAESFPANPLLDAGIREALAAHPDLPIDYFTEYLESDFFPGEQATLAFVDYVRRKYEGRRLDLVIAMTGAGLRFVLNHRQTLFPHTPIVFFGLATVDERTHTAGAGVTGVTVGAAYSETLKLALALHPSTERVFVVARRADDLLIDSVRARLRDVSQQVSLTYLDEATLPGLLSAIRAIPARSVILFVWHSQTDSGNIRYSDTVAELVAKTARVPVYGSSDLYIGTGVVGGVVRMTRETGYRLGEMAIRVLTGTRPRDIPIEAASVIPVIDWRQVQRWNIPPSRLPAGARILFREPSVWEQYRVYILGAVIALVAQTALIAGLLIQRTRRHNAEQLVRHSQAALHNSYDRVRNLGKKLLNAQERERSRIARELHDDITQQLAVLKLDLTILQRTMNGSADADAMAAEAVRRAETIAMSVHGLSHRLHPARLQLIGLVEALDELRGEMTRPEMTIAFTHENVPAALPPHLTLCLFRIVQEALQNAIKYSRAGSVSVDLHAEPEALALTIEDDGVGFDVDVAWGRGLGLLSVRERVEAIGATLAIRSSSGAGTRLQVRVPASVWQETKAVAI